MTDESPTPTPPAEEDAKDAAAEAPEEAAAGSDAEERSGGIIRRVGRFFQKDPDREQTPLEVRTHLLDAVERALRPYRAERPLPFNRINLHLLAPTSRRKTLYTAALDGGEVPFAEFVRSRLHEAGFTPGAGLAVKSYLHHTPPKRLAHDFETHGAVVVELKQQASRASATLTVLSGKAEETSYRLRSTDIVHLGRMREVVDRTYGQVVRHNDVAFLDHEDPSLDADERAINETVSRRHARISFDAAAAAFLLTNEAGTTSVSRAAFPRPVRVGKQPVPLEDGDLIYLGRACLRFDV